jgi:hypothetical protein
MSTRSALANPERDGRPRAGELESVLQEVSHDRGENLPVGLDCHAVLDRRHVQSDAPSVRVQCRGRCDFFDEPRNEELLSVLNALCETDLRERTSNERV